MQWIKLWTEETIKGTTFVELDAASRGVWFSLLALAGVEGAGFVQASVGRGYSHQTLADILNVKIDELTTAIDRLVLFKKIKILEHGEIEIVNFCKYQDEYHRQKPYRIAKKTILKKQKELQAGLQDELQDRLQAGLQS